MNLAVTAIERQRAAKLRDAQLVVVSGGNRQLVLGGGHGQLVVVADHIKGSSVLGNNGSDGNFGIVGVSGSAQLLRVGDEVCRRDLEELCQQLEFTVLFAEDVAVFANGSTVVIRGKAQVEA